ncbi:hypothetical protein GH714_010672 [Hevea brasiliensis]|uniref:Protein farnesyltransferase/geranylgeranyltransferase type-1 subunit alpha n=1 Tax=Hevea brasiliensis TaxID=3981 RepID=A0A6A6LJC8_HEVBR|nr:hypothetical protein GH714_010672 [Hevea brasiliensis]
MNLERTVRIKNGFLEITETKSEREGPKASRAYPIPAATVISLFSSHLKVVRGKPSVTGTLTEQEWKKQAMDSDDDLRPEEMVPLSQIPEWSDVVPVPKTTVPIRWRLVLEALNADLDEELDYVERIAKKNSKNYQIWHHRRWVSEKLGLMLQLRNFSLPGRFFPLMLKIIMPGPTGRLVVLLLLPWVLQALGGWEDELDYCGQLLEDDVFNNSAWNQRYFVITRSPFLGGLKTMRESEVKYTVEAILANPENESSWRYLRGLYKGDTQSLSNDLQVSSVCLKVLNGKTNHVFALSMLLDLLCHGFQANQEFRDAVNALRTSNADPPETDLAKAVCSVLEHFDPLRVNYWSFRKSKLPVSA